MSKFIGYICSLCQTEYAPDEVTYTCPKDGGNLDVVLDYDAIKSKFKPEDILSRSDPSLWRFLPLLPVREPPGEDTPLHVVGGTPVFGLPRLAKQLGLQNLWLKDEFAQSHGLLQGSRLCHCGHTRPGDQCSGGGHSFHR